MDYKAELYKAKSDLDQAVKLQDLMKKANAILRGGKNVKERLLEIGFSENQAEQIQKPDYVGRTGFPQFKLTNNNALIKRLEDKVKNLEMKFKASKSDTEERYLFDGGEILINYDINRVQILFPGGRTSKDNFQLLRRNGFVYSPTNSAFQRQITPIAIRTAISLFDAKKVEETELQKGIDVESEHTDTIEKIASGEISPEQAPEEIAKDHLTEDTKYYDKLEEVEGKKNELNPRDSWYINREGTPYGIDRVLISLVKNGNNEQFEKDFERVISNPNYNTKEKFIEGINDEQTDILQKINKKEKEVNEWVERGGPHLKKLPKYDEWQNDIKALKILENHLSVLDAIAEHYFDEKDKPSVNAVSTEYFEPNTEEEFEQAIIDSVKDELFDSWIGNQAKQRSALNSIAKKISGDKEQKADAVKDIFKKLYQQTINDENYTGTKQLAYDPVNEWITDKNVEPNKSSANIKRESMFNEKIIDAIKDKLPKNWLGEQTGEVAVANLIWKEIESGNTELFLGTHDEKVKKKQEIYNQLFNETREKEYGYDKDLAIKYKRVIELSPDDFKEKFGIKNLNIDDKQRVYFTFKNDKNLELDLTLKLKPIELYGSRTSELWDRMQDIQYWVTNASQYIDDNPELILANLKTKNKEWSSHPKGFRMGVEEKLTKNENNMTLQEFKENLSELDIDWQPFTSPNGETRFFRKFLFSPEEQKSGIAREVTDLGLTGGWEDKPKGYVSVVVDVSNLAVANKIDELHHELVVEPSNKIARDKMNEKKYNQLLTYQNPDYNYFVSYDDNSVSITPFSKSTGTQGTITTLYFEDIESSKINEALKELILKKLKNIGISTNKKTTEKKENLSDLFDKFYEVVTFHEDARHGWLEVPKSWLTKLGIAHEISSFSYEKDGKVYLEEDSDLGTFINAVDKYITWSHNLLKKTYKEDSPIRNYTHYKTPSAPKNEVISQAKPTKKAEINIFEGLNEKLLRNFIPGSQISSLMQMAKGEESSEAVDIVQRLNKTIASMPEPYGSEGVENKLAYLHYFNPSSDWFIIEKDIEGEQKQAYGWVILNGDTINAEYGYIDIDTLIKMKGVELDFYFEPTPIKQIIKEHGGENYENQSIENELIIKPNTQFDFKADKLGEIEKQIVDEFISHSVKVFREYGTRKDTLYIQYDNKFFKLDFYPEHSGLDITIIPGLLFGEKTNEINKKKGEFLDTIYYDFLSANGLVVKIIEKLNEVSNEEYKQLVESFNGMESPHEKTYSNPYELNKAIEKFLDDKKQTLGEDAYLNPDNYTSMEIVWLRQYSGYGGLSQFGPGGKGAFFEYYTPLPVIRKMWALAYKYGFKGGAVLEPSVATGEFLSMAPYHADNVTGYEINYYSWAICKILYPKANIILAPFERTFIKNNYTMKDKVEPVYDLAIGNPPYGSFDVVKSREMNMGELDHVKAKNYAEYFIRRGIDLLKPGGLLIYIVGASIEGGGQLFLDSGISPVKEYLAEHCDLLDAYRLPDAIFERTGVTSEIIVLQKK